VSCCEIRAKREVHDMHIKGWSATTSSSQASNSYQTGRFISTKKLCSITIATLHLLTADTSVVQTDVSQQLTSQLVVRDIFQAPSAPPFPLTFRNTLPGRAIKPGTELRILPVGDSITYGFLSNMDGGDGNGYRLWLREDLSSKSQRCVMCLVFTC
jgi:hypothetical protein